MNARFEKMEKRLKCQFPSDFKEYMSSISSEEIILRLFDDDYKVLYSITKEKSTDWYEGVVNMSMDFSQSSFRQEDKGLTKLPFARIVDNDGFKYLYFLCKGGKESNGEIYMHHLGSPSSKRIRVFKNISSIRGNITREETKTIVDCTDKTFKELTNSITVSKNICVWQDSFEITSEENIVEGGGKIDLNKIDAIISEVKGVSKSFVKFKVQCSVAIGKKLFISSKAYKINIAGLKPALSKNSNYSIFYHKLICSLDCLKGTFNSLLESGDIDKDKFNGMFNREVFINQVKKGFGQIDIEKERMISGFGKIEQKLNCKFPSEFKDYLSTIKKKKIVLRLFDEDYRILYSLTKKGELMDRYEDVVSCSENHTESYYPEDEGIKKLPFARALSGDKYKYLYFLCKEGEESKGEIYIRDMDSPATGRIRISKNISLIKGNIIEKKEQVIVDCTDKKIEDIIDCISISNNISVWDDSSFGTTSRDNTGEKEKVDLSEVNATIFDYENKTENFVKIEVQMKIVTSKRIIFSSKAYHIDITGLKYQIENNINYRVFYHKFICCLDCLNESVKSAITNGDITMNEFTRIFNLSAFVNQIKGGFIQIDYKRIEKRCP